MSTAERLRDGFAWWCPEFGKGRISVGPMVLMTRAELSRMAMTFHEGGRRLEREEPTPNPQPQGQQRRLHLV